MYNSKYKPLDQLLTFYKSLLDALFLYLYAQILTMKTIYIMSVIEALKWRYAVKKMNGQKVAQDK